MSERSVFIYHSSLEKYCFYPEHPFGPSRLRTTVSLLEKLGLIRDEDLVTPRPAFWEELLLAHDTEYLNMVRKLSRGMGPQSDGSSFGLGTEDNPVFSGMHEAAGLIVGATLTAVEAVMEGRADHALNISGGLHHAGRKQAAGFCIYNDLNAAIRYVREKYHARVIYIDTDAHHGDGVQWEFYQDPNVLTISFHETGRYLYPGTGWLNERGQGEGYGYCINVPLEAFTWDESFLECFNLVVPPIVEAFQPDLIISQNGCDGHSFDPLTHIDLTMKSFLEIPRIVHRLAHRFAGGRWVAVGGGGYDPYRVVPRAWVLLWAELRGLSLPEAVPDVWLKQWQKYCSFPLPQTIFDPENTVYPIPRRSIIAEKNSVTAAKVLQDAMILFNKYL